MAVLATTKVPNLKANHNYVTEYVRKHKAVLATTKVPNLKANHNALGIAPMVAVGCISYYESTEFES